MTEFLNGGPAETQPRGTYHPLLKWKRGQEILVRVVSDCTAVVDTHWVGQSILCVGPERCPLCQAGSRVESHIWAIVEALQGQRWLTRLPYSAVADTALDVGASVAIKRHSGSGGYRYQMIFPEPCKVDLIDGRKLVLSILRIFNVRFDRSYDHFESVGEIYVSSMDARLALAEAAAEEYRRKKA